MPPRRGHLVNPPPARHVQHQRLSPPQTLPVAPLRPPPTPASSTKRRHTLAASLLPSRSLVAAAPSLAQGPSRHAAGRFFPTRHPASPLLSWRNLCKLLVAGVWLRGGAISRLQPLAKPHLYSARPLYRAGVEGSDITPGRGEEAVGERPLSTRCGQNIFPHFSGSFHNGWCSAEGGAGAAVWPGRRPRPFGGPARRCLAQGSSARVRFLSEPLVSPFAVSGFYRPAFHA